MNSFTHRGFWAACLVACLLGATLAISPFATSPASASVPSEPQPWDAYSEVRCGNQAATIHGTSGADVINGTSGNDVIYGYGGNDIIDGKGGHDVIFGGTGHDTLIGGNGADTLCGEGGNDTLNGNAGNDWLRGGSGWDTISGGNHADTIFGDSGNDNLQGEDGWDTIVGGAHDDTILGGKGNDKIQGGTGNDTINGMYQDDLVFGGDGNDIIEGGNDTDVLVGNAGNDTIKGMNGNDTLFGSAGNDNLSGGPGTDVLVGGAGTDVANDTDETLADAPPPPTTTTTTTTAAPTTTTTTTTTTTAAPTTTTIPAEPQVPSLADIGISINADGSVIGAAAGNLPVPISFAPPAPYAATPAAPAESPSVCSASGLTLSIYPPAAGPATAQVSVPPGVSIYGQSVHRKENFNSGGNWGTWTSSRIINEDGTLGPIDANLSGLSDYYWSSSVHERNEQRLLTNNSGETQDYFLEMSLSSAVSISSADGRSSNSFENLRFVADGKDLGPVCATEAFDQCIANGGNLFLEEPVVLDGQTYSGCQSYESCFADWNFLFIDEVAVLSCENDALLTKIQIAALVVVVVAGSIYVGSAASPTIARFAAQRAASAGIRGAGTVEFAVNAAAPAALITAYLALHSPSADGLNQTTSEFLADSFDMAVDYFTPEGPANLADYPQLTLDPVSGIHVIRTEEVVATVLTSAAINARIEEITAIEFPDPNENQGPRQELAEQISRSFKAATATCLALFTSDIIVDQVDNTVETLQIPFSSLNLGGVELADISPQGVVQQVGPNFHVCERVPIYMPGAFTLKNGTPMGEAVLHMSEALGEIDATAWTNPWTGPQPPANPFWTFQFRSAPQDDTWRKIAPVNCVGSGTATNCDEWPWKAAAAGGEQPLNSPLRPHLRIMSAGHNQTSGNELGKFYSTDNTPIACGIDNGELFLVLPQTGLMLNGAASVASGTIQFAPVRSRSICAD